MTDKKHYEARRNKIEKRKHNRSQQTKPNNLYRGQLNSLDTQSLDKLDKTADTNSQDASKRNLEGVEKPSFRDGYSNGTPDTDTTLDEIEKELKEEIPKVIISYLKGYYGYIRKGDIKEMNNKIEQEITRIFSKYKKKKNG